MNQNIITKLKLETVCRALKQQGYTVRDISKELTKRSQVSISASAVFRYLSQSEMKQIVQPPKMEGLTTLSKVPITELKQEAEPQKPKVLILIPYPPLKPCVSAPKPISKVLVLTPSSDDDRIFWM
jgi:hypothetical protein